MDEEGLGRVIRGVVVNAVQIAGERGSSAVEAEHLLLALAADATSPAAVLLTEFGLDEAAITAALNAERAASLRTIGIVDGVKPPVTAAPRTARPSWGTSVREALRRGHGAAGSRAGGQRGGRGRDRFGGRMAELDVLAGILLADVGTVPRALALAGVDHDALVGRVERERRR